jgi:phospho-N-acetylmuramoyl-pentapeptide-transferase
MGGLLMILVVIGVSLVIQVGRGNFLDPGTFAPLATLALVGALGTADDWLNARTGDGIRARHKVIWQTVVALVVAWQIQDTYDVKNIVVPLVGPIGIEPWLYILFGAFAIVATSNSVNITDGLDGLAGGLIVFAFIGFMAIAALNVPITQPNLAILCGVIIGAVLGFLWFNVHPAQVFMGDSGSLGLGATLAVTALITGQVMLLPVIGLVFVLEAVQDIAQILWFKWKGRRLFRMAPLHHHFELSGWPEEKITLRFWIVGALSALIGVAFFLGTRGTLR